MTPATNHSNKDQMDQRIAYLIESYNSQSLTPDEHDELDSWVGASDENMRVFEERTNKSGRSGKQETVKYTGYIKYMTRIIKVKKGLRFTA